MLFRVLVSVLIGVAVFLIAEVILSALDIATTDKASAIPEILGVLAGIGYFVSDRNPV